MDLKSASQTLISAYHTPHPPHFQMRKLSDRVWHSHLPAALRVGEVKCNIQDSFWSSDLGVMRFPVEGTRSPHLKLGQPSLALAVNLTYWKPRKKVANFGQIKRSLNCVWLFVTPWSLVHGILQARIMEWVAIPFSRGSSQPRDWTQRPLHCRWILYQLSHQNTGVGSLSFLQRVFQTQELNWGLLHCRWILYQLSYQGSPGKDKLLHIIKINHERSCSVWAWVCVLLNRSLTLR